MILILAVLEFFKPLRTCTGLALFRSGVITALSFCAFTVLKFLFQATVIDRRDGSLFFPYREDAVLFGVCIYLSFRAFVNNMVLARYNPAWLPLAIPPIVAYIVVGIFCYASVIAIWICFPQTFSTVIPQFIGQIMVPVSFASAPLLANLAMKVNTNTLGSAVAFFIIVYMLQVVIFLELTIVVSCLVITNIRNESFLVNLESYNVIGGVSIDQQLITGVLVGAIYPLLKYTVTFISQKTFAFTVPPIPQSRMEEIVSNTTLFTMVTGGALLWDAIGYLIMLRIPSNVIFYISFVTTCLCNLVNNITKAYWLRRRIEATVQVQNDCGDTESESALSKAQDGYKPDAGQLIASTALKNPPKYHNDVNRTVLVTAFNPSRAEKTVQDAISRKANETLGLLIVPGDEHIRSSFAEVFSDRMSSTSMAECEHSKTQPIQWNIASVDYNTDCLKEKRSSYSIRSLPVLATSETLSSSGIKIAPEEPRSVFLPLSEPAKYAFLRIGLLSANWSCYWVAASVILLFATLPEASVWSATYYAVPIIVLFTRVLVGSFICAIMDAMSLFIEAKILRVDFADGVKECRVASLSSGAYLHLLGYTISIAGPFIIADALFNSSPTYIAGRRRW